MERLRAHEELQELLGAYALDAVEPEEAAAIERHLPTCPRCRAELTDHREVAALLGYAGANAPSGVWDRIVASLEEPPPALNLTRISTPPSRTAPESGTSRDVNAISPDWGPKTPPPIHARSSAAADHMAPVVPMERGRRAKRTRFMVALASAAAIIAVALGIEVGRLQVRKTGSNINLQTIARQVYDKANADPNNPHLKLTSTDGTHTVSAVMVSGGVTYLGPGLENLPNDEAYQMWAVVDGAPVSLGVIGPDPTYHSFTTPSIPKLVLAMTVEKSGGVVRSSNPAVVAGVANA